MKGTRKSKAKAKNVKAITEATGESAGAEVRMINDSRESVAAEVYRASEPTIEQVRQRAYELFLARGRTHGDDQRDWFLAERELRRAK